MMTPYDVLGVPRNAGDERIRTAFRKAAKAYHPDLNAGDPTAEQQLRRVISAYEILRNRQKRMAYDRYLRSRRRERVRHFAVPAVAGVVTGSIVALGVWLSVSLSKAQEASGPPQAPRIAAAQVSQPASPQVAAADGSAGRQEADRGRKGDRADRRFPDDPSRHLQQSAGNRQPTASHPEPQALAREWGQVQASGDPMAIWAFAARNPDAPESELARSKLIALIDATGDVFLLHVLRIGAPDAIAERAQQRLVRLGALAVAEADSAASRAAPSDSLERRAASLVSAQISGWSSTNASNLASLTNAYADKVVYQGSRKSRQAVLLDKRRLLEQWPERVYDVRPGSLTVQCRANVCKVAGIMDWQTRSVRRAAAASGSAQFEYEIALSRGAFKILSESSSAVTRYGQEDGRSQSRRTRVTAHQQGVRDR